MANPPKIQKLIALAQAEADLDPAFCAIKGPGVGDRATARFIATLREKARAEFGSDFAEHKVLPDTPVRVDCWFPEEGTILEVALGPRNPLSEFERDVLKAVIAKRDGVHVERLVFVTKPGAERRLASPWFQRVIQWAAASGVEVVVHELGSRAA